MKTDNRTTLRHIAAVYLDTYASPRDLARPLTPEQVKDAGVLLLDLLAANEAELLLEQERAKLEERQPTLREISVMFMTRYVQENGIDEPLGEQDWLDASETFLAYISGCPVCPGTISK